MLDFYKGMDVSFVPQCLDEGMVVTDFDGTVMHPLELAKKYGVNSIRLRLWNEPENMPQSKGYCSLAHTIAMAKKVKELGLSFMLDFHYSDWWADPGQQRKPKAWENLTGEALEQAVYEFTRDTLNTLKAEGVLPDMVQIGNEIRSGLLFPDGEWPNFANMVKLVNAGIRGAREAAGDADMKIMIHLDQGGRYLFIKEWFDNAFANGLMDFDIIGLSYYAFWHGTFMDLKNTMEKLLVDYGKPIIVAETAHAWRKSEKGFIDEAQEKIAGIPATPAGQKKVIDMVMNIVASLPDKQGLGVYYWEPLCIPRPGDDGWSENMGILGATGQATDTVKSFLFEREQACPEKIAKVYVPDKKTVLAGAAVDLPGELNVLYYSGNLKKHAVIWKYEEQWWQTPGTYRVTGVLDGVDGETPAAECTAPEERVEIEIQIVEHLEVGENILQDSRWDTGLTAWNIEKSGDEVAVLLYPDAVEPFPAPPVNTLRLDSPKNFKFTISQEVTLQSEGSYTLKVDYRGVDTTNVDVRLFMQTEDAYHDVVIHPTDDDWTTHELAELPCKPGKATVGIKISAPPIFGLMRRFSLEKK